MILATAHPCVLLILHLYFKTYRQDWGVVLVNASIAVELQTKIINSFCREGEQKDVDKYNRDILLTTTACVSTGLNITAANNFVLFDPLWMVKDQMQAFARVHRTSQKQQTHLTLLYSNGNLAEQSIITRQQTHSKALEMT
jgi:predicted helicase